MSEGDLYSLIGKGIGAPGVLDPISFSMTSEPSVRGVIVIGADHRISFANSGINGLLAVDASDMVGKDAGDVVGILKDRFQNPDAYEQRSSWLRDNPDKASEDVMELVVPEHRILHRYSTPLLDAHGQPTIRVEVYSDITKRRQLEDANITLYKHICSAYEELKSTQDQLLQSEKLRAIGEIASGVAHDFNNTLGIILGNIQLLLRTAQDEKMRSRLMSVEQAALDGAETVRRIREFTKIQPDEPLSTIDLSTMVTAVVEVMRPSWESGMHARDCHIGLEFDLGDNVHAAGISAEIREVLANVLLNSVQAMPDGGALSISTGRSESSSWVRIADTGCGMTEDVRKRVFDPFFTTKGVEGTGLGMSVAYGIVKRHRGSISIESTPGEGTAITISLPAVSTFEPEKVEKRPIESTEAIPAKILVVDDQELFAQAFSGMLSEYGHAVCVARSGPEAIEQFKSEPFDLVFTDLGMPGMSGWQVAKSIKDMDPETPVVLMTGWGSEVDTDRLAESQVDMVLSKPVKMEDLSGIVSNALSRNRDK